MLLCSLNLARKCQNVDIKIMMMLVLISVLQYISNVKNTDTKMMIMIVLINVLQYICFMYVTVSTNTSRFSDTKFIKCLKALLRSQYFSVYFFETILIHHSIPFCKKKERGNKCQLQCKISSNVPNFQEQKEYFRVHIKNCNYFNYF